MTATRILSSLVVPVFVVLGSRSSSLNEVVAVGQDASGDPKMIELIAESPQDICGGEDIWRLLTPGNSVASIRNIKWEKIDSIAEDYIEGQEDKVKALDMEIQDLQKRIEQKMKDEARHDVTADQVKELITQGVTGANAFGKLEKATGTKCGVPSIKPRAPRYAYRNSVTAFKKAAEAFFKGKERLSGDVFLSTCAEVLPCGDEKEDCYCQELCQRFQDEAQELSDSTAGSYAGRSSDELLQSQKKKKMQRNHHESEMNQCKDNKAKFEKFAANLQTLAKVINRRFKSVRDASWALMDAEDELQNMEDALEDQKKATKEAVEAAETAGEGFDDAKKALQEVEKDEEAVVKAKDAFSAALAKTTKALKDSGDAKDAAEGLKLAVSDMMLKMYSYFEEEVQEPVRFTGLDETTDLNDFFPADNDASLVEAEHNVNEAVNAMGGLCEKEAHGVFSKVKAVDLSPLCSFGATSEINEEIHTTVVERTKIVRKRIEDVQSWLSPNRGEGDDARIQKFLDAGEPMGLRNISGIYDKTSFHKNYLLKWSAGGEFLALMAKLGEAMESMQKEIDSLKKAIKGLQDSLAHVIQKHKAATQALAAAEAADKAAKNAKKHMQDKVKELEAARKKLEAKKADLEDKLKAAEARLKTAQEQLVATYVEDLKDVKASGAALIELVAQGREADRKTALLELSLMAARRKQLTARYELALAQKQIAAEAALKPIKPAQA